MTVPWIAARLRNQTLHARRLLRWMLAAAIVGVGLAYSTIISDVRGGGVLVQQLRGAEIVKTIGPPSVQTTHTAAAPGSPCASLSACSGARFRFGFLEFEDDPDEVR